VSIQEINRDKLASSLHTDIFLHW